MTLASAYLLMTLADGSKKNRPLPTLKFGGRWGVTTVLSLSVQLWVPFRTLSFSL